MSELQIANSPTASSTLAQNCPVAVGVKREARYSNGVEENTHDHRKKSCHRSRRFNGVFARSIPINRSEIWQHHLLQRWNYPSEFREPGLLQRGNNLPKVRKHEFLQRWRECSALWEPGVFQRWDVSAALWEPDVFQ